MKVNGHRFCVFFSVFIILTALLLLIKLPETHALKPGEVSLAAEMTAGFRAIAAMDPDEKIKNPDYLAEKFLTPTFWFLSSLNKDYKKSKLFIQHYRISAYYTANAMTKFVDDILQKIAEEDLKQVVNIGAGFDSHPYRFEKQLPHVRFFEIDLPATQSRKKKMVKGVFGALPESVTYIPIDYRTQPVFNDLKLAGYDSTLKTLFIWTDVTQFSDPKIVDLTMRDIARNSSPESELIFSYIFDQLVKGDFSRYQRAMFTSVRLAAGGEPWKFGIPVGQGDDFLTQRGLKVIAHLDSEKLAQKYLVCNDGSIDGKPTPYVRVIHAIVNR